MSAPVSNLVLIHGWGSDSRCWDALLPELETLSLNIHCLDLPGFGCRAEEAWPDTETLLMDLESRLPDNCLLVGWSLGGMLAQRLAACSRKVRALVTIATNASFVERPGWPGMSESDFAGFCEAQAREPQKNRQRFCALQARGDRDMRSLAKTLKSWQPHTIPASSSAALACLGELDNRSLLAETGVPALHIFGDGDALVPLAAAEKLNAENLPVAVIAGTGHCPHISRPREVAAQIRGLVKQADADGAPLDKSAVARAFGRAAASYDGAAHLQRAVCRQLLSEVEDGADFAPRRILDLGSGTGYGSELLRKRFPEAEIIALDLAPQMLSYARHHRPHADRYIAADAEHLPLADDCVDLVFSSFALQWCYRLPDLFAEIRRIMRPDARALISTLVPGTLGELESSWAAVDRAVHVNRFLPAEEWRDACAGAGMACALTREQRVLHFDSVQQLMRELKSIGAHNVNHAAGKGLLSRQRLRRLVSAYEGHRTAAGLPATYEVAYLTLTNQYGQATADDVRPLPWLGHGNLSGRHCG